MAAENVGAVSSVTVTVNVSLASLLLESVAVHVTVVSPNGNKCPDGGLQLTVTDWPELSVAVGLYVTAIVLESSGRVSVRSGKSEIVGAMLSVTVTVNVVVSSFPELSDAVHETVVDPKVN